MQSSLYPFHLAPSASPFGVGRVLLHTLNQPLQSGPVQHGQLQKQHVQALCQASLLGSQQTSELVHQWLAAGVDIEDVYLDGITPAARLVGQWWCDDLMDFATGSLAYGRLRHLLFELSPAFLKNASSQAAGLSCCIVGAFQTQHTMGSFMLSEFFRRTGWQVNLLECDSADELLKKMVSDWYDLLAISLSSEQQLPSIRQLVKQIRRSSANPRLQILAGGPLVAACPELLENLGVELVTQDARAAQDKALELVMAVRCRSQTELTLVNVS
jgi:methanogenic corrinoid protein MtbC1